MFFRCRDSDLSESLQSTRLFEVLINDLSPILLDKSQISYL
jgi:hypothetical protein